MYTVYLIDDERWALYDLQHSCPFAAHGFAVVGAQTDPFAALDEIAALRPHVVFLDVRMPLISGLDLLRMIRGKAEECGFAPPAFVIVSGYAEFEYAHEALRLGVVDYCLKPLDVAEARALLQRLSAALAGMATEERAQRTGEAGSGPAFSALLEYVSAHVTEPLVLGELAKAFYLNASYCGERFKEVTGETFTHYVRRRRLEKACELLERTGLPLSQIALRVGYPDLPYFSRVFTASFGVSPSRYRAARREKGRR